MKSGPSLRISVFHGFPEDLVHGGQSGLDFLKAALPERDHPFFDGFFLALARRSSHQAQLLNRLTDFHDFVHTDAPLLARPAASAAAFAVLRLDVSYFTARN